MVVIKLDVFCYIFENIDRQYFRIMRKQFEQYLLNCFLLYYEGVTDEEDKIQRIYMFSGILYCYGIMRMPEGGEGIR